MPTLRPDDIAPNDLLLDPNNFRFQDSVNYWQVDKAHHRLYVAKDFDGTTDFPTNDLWYWRNRKGGASHGLLLRPHSLRWVNKPDLSDMSLFRSFQAVGSRTFLSSQDPSDILWRKCLFELQSNRRSFRKILQGC